MQLFISVIQNCNGELKMSEYCPFKKQKELQEQRKLSEKDAIVQSWVIYTNLKKSNKVQEKIVN